jgi:peptidoglycan DL-endopeptidase RipA
MSHGEDLFAPRDEVNSRPSFEFALRGYDKRQVDDYVSQLDSDLSRLAAERDRAFRHIQDLASQLEHVKAELAEVRLQPPQVDRASFRDLGPTVDQILALAEHQAETITNTAAQRAGDHQAEAERVLADAQQRADRLRAEAEAVREQAAQEAQRVNEQCVQQVEQARAEAESLVEAACNRAQQEIEAARTQTQEEIQVRQQALAALHSDLDAAQQQLHQSRQEAAGAEREVSQLQQRVNDLGEELAAELERLEQARRSAESAERHAKEVRAKVQREAERVAQLAASAVMAAAARGAETGEYPMVVPVGPAGNGNPAGSDHASAEPGVTASEPGVTAAFEPGVPTAGKAPGDPGGHADVGGHFRLDLDHAVPTQREPQPRPVGADTD